MKARWPVAVGIVAAAALSVPTGAMAQSVSFSSVEKIYAELAALPKAERSQRIVEGARAERPAPRMDEDELALGARALEDASAALRLRQRGELGVDFLRV